MDNLNGSQLLTAGAIMQKVSEEIEKTSKDNCDKDVKKAFNYILKELDEINKKIAEEALKRTIESINRMRELINEG